MPTIPAQYVGTQYGVCIIFADLFGRDVRWIDPVDWYAWSGNCWEPSAEDDVRGMIRQCGEWILGRAQELQEALPGDEEEGEGVADHRKRLVREIQTWHRWCKDCSDSHYQNQVMKQLRAMPAMKIPVSMTLAHRNMVNTRTGVVDLEEPGILHRHPNIRNGGTAWYGERPDTSMLHCCQILPFLLPPTL